MTDLGDAEYEDRGKLSPCPGCGGAPDHRPDDQKCVERRYLAVRRAREAQQALLQLEREAEQRDHQGTELAQALRRLMVD